MTFTHTDIEIRRYQKGDMEAIKENPLEEVIKDYPELLIPENSYTAVRDGKIVAAGGVIIYWKGFAEGWFAMTKDVLNFKMKIYRCVKEMTELMIERHGLKRLQIVVRVDYPKAVEMAEHLGFKNETPDGMENYTPDGMTCYLYSRIKK